MKHQIIDLQFSNNQFDFYVVEKGTDKLINADIFSDDGNRFKIKDPWKGSSEEFEVFALYGNENKIMIDNGDLIAYNVMIEVNSNLFYIITSQEFNSDFEIIQN